MGTGKKFSADKLFCKISHSAESGVVGDVEYEVHGEVKLSVATTFTSSGTLTVQGRIKHSTAWQNIGTLTFGGDFDTFDIDVYDYIRFNFTGAAGSTGEIAASGFFKASAAGGGSGATNSFTTIQPDAGTAPVADSATDTLTFTSSDGSVTITGDSTTDTIDLTGAGGGGGGSGDVVGPASSVNNAIPRFDGTSGKLLQNTTNGPIINDSGELLTPDSVAGTECTKIGGSNTITGVRSTAVGQLTSTAQDAVSIGYNADATSTGATAIGTNASASGGSSFALGNNAVSSGTVSVAIGVASSSIGTISSIAIGNLSSATQSYSLAIGDSASATTTNGAIAIGRRADASTGTGPIAIGQDATAAATSSVAIGYQASVNASNATAIGREATVASGAFDSVVLGYRATSSHQDCIVFGNGADTTAIRQFIAGGPNLAIAEVVFGKGPTSTSPVDLTIRTSDALGTDKSAKNVTLRAGAGTGTGSGGHLIFQTAAAGTTGSTLNALTTHLEITDDGNVIMANLPTSSAGLPTGALWNNSGVLNIA